MSKVTINAQKSWKQKAPVKCENQDSLTRSLNRGGTSALHTGRLAADVTYTSIMQLFVLLVCLNSGLWGTRRALTTRPYSSRFKSIKKQLWNYKYAINQQHFKPQLQLSLQSTPNSMEQTSFHFVNDENVRCITDGPLRQPSPCPWCLRLLEQKWAAELLASTAVSFVQVPFLMYMFLHLQWQL